MSGGRVAARPFHFRDCDRYGGLVPDGCAAELEAGQQWELGRCARADYVMDEERGRTVFVGVYEDWTTWRRQPRVSTAAAVDTSPGECRHFVPAAEFCPDCSEPALVDELHGYELEDHATPDVVVFADEKEATLW